MSSAQEQRKLNKLLTVAKSNPKKNFGDVPCATEGRAVGSEDQDYGKMCQWNTCDGTKFFPTGLTVKILPSGVYEPKFCGQRGYYFEKLETKTEGLLRFPETNSERVIKEIQSFWEKEELFRLNKVLYKRGIILWGPPGSGKSCTIQLIIADVMERGGVVLKLDNHPSTFIECMRHFRTIQPTTRLVVLMEDIDSLLERFCESEVLNILDGVEKIENVVFLATTNYPEKLGDRIINRPSRFDKRFMMPHPKAKSRRIFFEHLFSYGAADPTQYDLDRWVRDTSGMSVAHLKELFISVCIFGDSYEDAIETLRAMIENPPESSDAVPGKAVGFVKLQNPED